jgi:hypothetical protein
MAFDLVICDAGFRYDFLNEGVFDNSVWGFEIYMASGGILAYFGSLEYFHNGQVIHDLLDTYPITREFPSSRLGIDSVFMMGVRYYDSYTSPPYVDSLIGMTWAEGTSGIVPNVWYNSLFPHNPILETWWPTTETAPAPVTFRTNENSEVIQVLRSNSPATSLAEGDPIGVMASTGPAPAFAFGYHLWYMDQTDGRSLIDYMMSFTGETVAAATTIDPDTIYTIFAHSYNPLSGDIWLGDLSGGYSPGDINSPTLTINESTTPTAIVVEPTHPDFTGEVLKMTFDMDDFVAGYDLLWGDRLRPYIVSGEMNDGTPLTTAGGVYLIGHTPGDANRDMIADIGDAVFMIQYIFGDGPPPEPYALGDANGDCDINIGDIVYLVSYVFRHGAQPLEGCAP